MAPLACASIDVDFVASTRDCMKHLYLLLVSGSSIVSQGGHLPLVPSLICDERFGR